MKCPEVYAWLLISRTTQTPPHEISRHLRRCPKCQARRTRLLLLDEELALAPHTLPNPETKARFVAQLDQFAPRVAGTRRGNGRRWGAIVAALAAVLLAGIGLMWLTSGTRDTSGTRTSDTDGRGDRVAARAAEEQLVARFVDHNVQFAAAFQPSEQATLMNAMAFDLRGEAVRLAQQGQPDDLPLLAALYDAVVRRGMVGRLRQLSPEQRQKVLPVFVKELRDAESSVDAASNDRSLVVADYLQPIRDTAQETAVLLQREDKLVWTAVEPLPTFAGGAGTPHALLALLVTQNLLLAEENDPLRRAYYCNELADQLALASLLASARGDHERAVQLNKHLTQIVDRGVGANLARMQQESPQDERLPDLTNVIQHLRRTVAALDNTPPPERKGDNRRDQAKDLEKTLKELEKTLKEVAKEKPKEKKRSANEEKESQNEDLDGTIRSIDTSKRLVELLVKVKGREVLRTLQVSQDAKFKGGPKGATLADLERGNKVEVKVRDGATVTEIRIEGKEK